MCHTLTELYSMHIARTYPIYMYITASNIETHIYYIYKTVLLNVNFQWRKCLLCAHNLLLSVTSLSRLSRGSFNVMFEWNDEKKSSSYWCRQSSYLGDIIVIIIVKHFVAFVMTAHTFNIQFSMYVFKVPET